MENDYSSHYTDKSALYFDGARSDFVKRLPAKPNGRILEIGCGTGGTGALALAEGKCAEYVAIEIVEHVATIAKEKLTEVYIGDVEKDFPDFQPESFDGFIASEVFEHLRDPWAVIQRILPLLKPGAVVLASSPNVSHRGVIRRLKRGQFEYADMGVMDRTHLRWFTPDSYCALFTKAGLELRDCWPIQPVRPPQRFLSKFFANGEKRYWQQICIEARKPLS